MSGTYATRNFETDVFTNVEGNMDTSDLLVTGIFSLYTNSDARYFNNVYCHAIGCLYGTREYINNLYGFGFYAISESIIENIFNYLICASSYSCYHTTINLVHNKIFGWGYYSLADSRITNVKNSITAIGEKSLYLSNIINASAVCTTVNLLFVVVVSAN